MTIRNYHVKRNHRTIEHVENSKLSKCRTRLQVVKSMGGGEGGMIAPSAIPAIKYALGRSDSIVRDFPRARERATEEKYHFRFPVSTWTYTPLEVCERETFTSANGLFSIAGLCTTCTTAKTGPRFNEILRPRGETRVTITTYGGM